MERNAVVRRVEGDFVTVVYENSENPWEEEVMDFLKPGLPLKEEDHVKIREEGGLSEIVEICNS